MVYYVFGSLFSTLYDAQRFCDVSGFDYSVIYSERRSDDA